MKHKIITAAGALLIGLGLSSCMEQNTVLTVKKDGSAVLEETALMGAQMASMLALGGLDPDNAGAPPPSLVPAEADLIAKGKSLGEGVVFQGVEEIKLPDGRQGFKASYTVADVSKLKITPGGLGTMQMLQPDDGDLEIDEEQLEEGALSFAMKDGALVVSMPSSGVNADEEETGELEVPEMDPEELAQMQMMAPMLQGMRVGFEIKAEGGIAESDALHRDGDTITLFEVNVGEMLKDPKNMGKMQALEDTENFSRVRRELQDVDGVKIEPRDEVTIKFQ
jgi:hypothetical protein